MTRMYNVTTSRAHSLLEMTPVGRCRLTPSFRNTPRACFQALKPKCEESLSNFAFNLNLRHYTPAYHLLAAMLCSCDLTDMRIARARHAVSKVGRCRLTLL